MPILIWLFVEIMIFIAFAKWLGIGVALLILFVPTIIGGILLKKASMNNPQNIANMQAQMLQGNPMVNMMKMMGMMFGGFLLLLPGFITTVIGLLILIPVTRLSMTSWLMKQNWFQSRFQSKMHGNPFSAFQDLNSSPSDTQSEEKKVHKGRIIDADE